MKWLLPSHGPIFRKDAKQIQKTINRLSEYQHMADFGTCAVDWPLLDEWDKELIRGFDPLIDAIDYGRELIPLTRKLIAERQAAKGLAAE